MHRQKSPRTTHLRTPPFSEHLPAAIVFRAADLPAATSYPRHRHAWGEFVYSFSGVMEIRMAQGLYLAPPQYGVWLPPAIEHVGQNRHEASHCSLYLSAELCRDLPDSPCALGISPLMKAMLEHLRNLPGPLPRSDADARLLRVLYDQVLLAPRMGSYLPGSDDDMLAPLLAELEADPADKRSAAELARAANTTERTLARRCRRDLGMPLSEWRQRLRVLKALPMLEAGYKVESVAYELGYGSASAFISMFRRLMGVTPMALRDVGAAGATSSL